ncbi:hypothetical protein Tco_1283801 [Tanacetum coccineum]
MSSTSLRRKGVIMHCEICKKEGHNVRGFPTKDGGSQFVKGGITTRGGGSTMGGKTVNKSPSIRVGKSVNASCSVRGGETVNASGSASGDVRTIGGVKSRGGVKTRGEVRQRGMGNGLQSSTYPHAIRPSGYGVSWDLVDEEAMVGVSIPVPTWPYDGTPDDLLSVDEIPVTNTQPMTSQEPIHEPSLPTPTILAPAHALVIRRESKRIKQINLISLSHLVQD